MCLVAFLFRLGASNAGTVAGDWWLVAGRWMLIILMERITREKVGQGGWRVQDDEGEEKKVEVAMSIGGKPTCQVRVLIILLSS